MFKKYSVANLNLVREEVVLAEENDDESLDEQRRERLSAYFDSVSCSKK